MASITELNELDDMLDKSKLGNAEESSDEEGQVAKAGDVDSKTEVTSRGERKARKALSKLGLVRITGINRVVMRRPKGVSPVCSS